MFPFILTQCHVIFLRTECKKKSAFGDEILQQLKNDLLESEVFEKESARSPNTDEISVTSSGDSDIWYTRYLRL